MNINQFIFNESLFLVGAIQVAVKKKSQTQRHIEIQSEKIKTWKRLAHVKYSKYIEYCCLFHKHKGDNNNIDTGKDPALIMLYSIDW